jgi:hypothetical protein
MVDHVILIDQLSELKLPSFILNWLTSFLTGRSHITKTVCGELRPLPINLSIVQRSGIEPTLYITLETWESDLKPLSNKTSCFSIPMIPIFLCPNVQMFNFKLNLMPFKVGQQELG